MDQDMMKFFQLGGRAPTELGGSVTNVLGATGAGTASPGGGILEILNKLGGSNGQATGVGTGLTGTPGTTGLGAGLGWNIGTGQLALGGLATLAGLFGSHQASKLARDQFKFTKDVTNTNLTNQIQSYNTALADRSRARGAMEGQDQSSVERYIEENKMKR